MNDLNTFVTGRTRSGKTYLVNEAFHKPARCFSLVVHPKRRRGEWWGPRATKLEDVFESWKRYREYPAKKQRVFYGHPVWHPPRAKKQASEQFELLVKALLDEAEERDWRGKHVRVVVIVDDAQILDGDTLERLSRLCLGVSIKVVALSQGITDLKKDVRNNLDHWIITKPGAPDLNVIRSQYGHLYDAVVAWCSSGYRYVEDEDGTVRCWEPWPSQEWHTPEEALAILEREG